MDFIMEYVKGINLTEYMIKKNGALNIQQIKEFVKQILEGLTFLHEKGIVHRDIKVIFMF